MSDVIASGTVAVRELNGHREWEEIVEVFGRDMNEAADEVCIEDIARRIAVNQAFSTDSSRPSRSLTSKRPNPRRVETLGVDLS